MGLDIRIPIGSLFVILGALLAGYGLVSNPAIYQRSLGIDINLWWGGALFIFGLAMLALAWRAAAMQLRSTREVGSAVAQGCRVKPT
jgi:multisubunit Na+/H+ antiporter MnhG subunit